MRHLLTRQPPLLPPRQRPVPLLTVIAREITLLSLIPEVRRNDPMSTRLRILAVLDHGVQTLLFRRDATLRAAGGFVPSLALGICFDAVDDTIALLARVEEDAGGGFAVAAGTARFLDELFQGAGEAVVGYEADVGGVDSHAEGGGGGDDVEGSGEGEGFFEGWDCWGCEAALNGDSSGKLEAGMVGLTCYTGINQTRGQGICCEAERDVYDACDWEESCRGD